jgi:ABC-2 type transport system permease protein
MNIYFHELKAYRKSTVLWTVGMAAIAAFMLSLFPAFAKDAEPFKRMLESFPEAVRQAFGLQIETILSILGFYSYTFTYILLCGAIQAMILGTSIVSKETREKTADFLLAKPVSRSTIMTSKLLAALCSLLITNAVFWVISAVMAQLVANEAFDGRLFILITLTLPLTQLIFFSLGFFVSVAVSRLRSVLSVSLGTVFAFFILGMFVSTTGDDALRYATPFKYFDTGYILQHASYEASYLVVGLLFCAAAIAGAYVLYLKKDIQSA